VYQEKPYMYILYDSIPETFLPEQATGVMCTNDREGNKGGTAICTFADMTIHPPTKSHKKCKFFGRHHPRM
jgi:hypothetical protein